MFGSNSVLLLWIKIKNGINQIFQWHLKPHIDRKQINLYKAYVFYGKYYCQPMRIQEITCYKKLWDRKNYDKLFNVSETVSLIV